MRLLHLFENDGQDHADVLIPKLLALNTAGLFKPEDIQAAFSYWSNDHWGDDYTAYEEMSAYISNITDLYARGGRIYRIVYVNDEREIDTTDLGKYWTHTRHQIRNFIEGGTFDSNPEYRDKDPYVIAAIVKPNSVSVPPQWMPYPEEQELNITGMGAIQSYDIAPYYTANQLSSY